MKLTVCSEGFSDSGSSRCQRYRILSVASIYHIFWRSRQSTVFPSDPMPYQAIAIPYRRTRTTRDDWSHRFPKKYFRTRINGFCLFREVFVVPTWYPKDGELSEFNNAKPLWKWPPIFSLNAFWTSPRYSSSLGNDFTLSIASEIPFSVLDDNRTNLWLGPCRVQTLVFGFCLSKTWPMDDGMPRVVVATIGPSNLVGSVTTCLTNRLKFRISYYAKRKSYLHRFLFQRFDFRVGRMKIYIRWNDTGIQRYQRFYYRDQTRRSLGVS